MRQHPVTTVTQRVRSVTNHDSKHMCKACNAHKFYYDGEIDAVYLLRRVAMNIMQRNDVLCVEMLVAMNISNDITSVMMNVASFLVAIDDVHLQKFRDSEEENREVQ